MDESKIKRRLPLVSDAPSAGDTAPAPAKKLMNEVLPDPTRPSVAGSARRRTLERLTRLVAIAAASTAIGARCGEHGGAGYGVVDPLPPPSDAGLPPTPTRPPTTPSPDVVQPPPSPGYGVVDPM